MASYLCTAVNDSNVAGIVHRDFGVVHVFSTLHCDFDCYVGDGREDLEYIYVEVGTSVEPSTMIFRRKSLSLKALSSLIQ